MQSHHNSSFLSAAESKLFAAAGTFNFSMAALAADSALAGKHPFSLLHLFI